MILDGERTPSLREGGDSSVGATEYVYQELRTSILRGKLRPNERLIETDLATQLGTSRTPIREATQRLRADGLIVEGRQGWSVKEFGPKEVSEIYDVRCALESYATGLAAQSATTSELDEIVKIHEKELLLIADVDREYQVHLNELFHEAIVQACGVPRLALAWQRNLAFHFGYPIANAMTEQELAETIGQHTSIVDALLARDSAAAEAAARLHILAAKQRALR